MENILSNLQQFWQFTGFANCNGQYLIMIFFGLLFLCRLLGLDFLIFDLKLLFLLQFFLFFIVMFTHIHVLLTKQSYIYVYKTSRLRGEAFVFREYFTSDYV